MKFLFNLKNILEYNQLIERVNDIENNNNVFEAQLQNKEFKSAVLNQLEDMTNKNSLEFKKLRSKNFRSLNIFNLLRKDSIYWRS